MENKYSLPRRKFISVVLSYIKLLKLSKTFNVLDLFISLLDITLKEGFIAEFYRVSLNKKVENLNNSYDNTDQLENFEKDITCNAFNEITF